MHDLVPASAGPRSFCTFRRLGQRLYGIETACVREVSPHLPMTPVPQTPQAVRGLFNLRSRIYLSLDMRSLLGLSATECTAESRLFILKPNVAQDVGVLVEQGGDIVHTSADLIEPAGGAADLEAPSASSMITGVCKLRAELMMVVDLTRLADLLTDLLR